MTIYGNDILENQNKLKFAGESVMVGDCMVGKSVEIIFRIFRTMVAQSFVDIPSIILNATVGTSGLYAADIDIGLHKHNNKRLYSWRSDSIMESFGKGVLLYCIDSNTVKI